jgi:hypothetical protein
MLLGGPDEIRDSHIETIVNMTTNRGGHGNCRNADVDFVSRDRSAPVSTALSIFKDDVPKNEK